MTQLLERLPVSGGLQFAIGIGAIIVATIIGGWIIRFFLNIIAHNIARRTRTDLDDDLLNATRKYIYLLIYIFGASILFDYLQTVGVEYVGEKIFHIVDGVIYGLGVVVVSILIINVLATIIRWYGRHFASRAETSVDNQFMPLLERAIKGIIFLLAVLIILEHYEVDIKGLVAVLGIGSLAVALAAQDTIANMIGGFVIMIDRPFREGDRVRLPDGTLCIVDKIGIRSTKLRTYDNTLIITPNAELMKSTIHNETYPYPEVRATVNVGVGYNSDIRKVREVMLDEAHKHPKVLKEPPPDFVFLDFGDSSLDVSIRCRVSTIEDRFFVSSDLREQVLNRFRVEGIKIPFPQRVVTMVKETGEKGEA